MNPIMNIIHSEPFSRFQEANRSKVCKEAFSIFIEYMKDHAIHSWTDMMKYAAKMDEDLHGNNPDLFGAGEAYKYDFERDCGENWYVVTFRAACAEVKGKDFWEKWKKANKKYAWSDV